MIREKISAELRERVLARDGYACRYCGSKTGPFHLDHVYPLSKGGETSFDNLVTSCTRCNLKKFNKIGIWPKPTNTKREVPNQIIFSMVFLILGFSVLTTPFTTSMLSENQTNNMFLVGGLLLIIGLGILIHWINSWSSK